MDYQEVFARLRSFENKKVGVGATAEEIKQAEKALEVRLPDSYKAFLREFGWAAIGPYEVYGLGPDVPSYLHLVEVAKSDQRSWDIPPHLVPFYNDGADNMDCFDARHYEGGECPIVVWYHELGSDQDLEVEHPNFASWLSERIDMGWG